MAQQPRLCAIRMPRPRRGSETPPCNRGTIPSLFFRAFRVRRGLIPPVPDEADPPRKLYGFKEREFKRDNAPGGAAAPSAKDLARLAGPVARTTPEKTGPKAGDPNDVYSVLEQNRRAERQHNLDAVEIRAIKSRRRRDYFLLLVGGNVFIVGIVALLGPNIVTVMFGLGGVVIFSTGLTWIMWQVMGRY